MTNFLEQVLSNAKGHEQEALFYWGWMNPGAISSQRREAREEYERRYGFPSATASKPSVDEYPHMEATDSRLDSPEAYEEWLIENDMYGMDDD